MFGFNDIIICIQVYGKYLESVTRLHVTHRRRLNRHCNIEVPINMKI